MTKSGAIKCLGKSFASEDERREYFRSELRKKLPELKKIEGFPIGDDEDIIALSDPPYYTACPNPWLNDFIVEWEKEKETTPGRKKNFKVDEPYASDISEGKNNPIYTAHSYHTKVPHPAIMRYILHYTEPGDIIFDGFAGTGMTGVAAQMCGYPSRDIELLLDQEFKNENNNISWGSRCVICSDLAPIASHINYNLNNHFDYEAFRIEAHRILEETRKEFGWIYQTQHNKSVGEIIYSVWSDILTCNNCSKPFSYWEAAVDYKNAAVKKDYKCPHCNEIHNNNNAKPFIKTVYDSLNNETRQEGSSEVIMINYKIASKRYEKKPDKNDFLRFKKIDEYIIKTNIAKNPMLFKGTEWGDTWRAGVHQGVKYWTDFYTKANLIILCSVYEKILAYTKDDRIRKTLLFWFTASQSRLHRMNRYSPQHLRHVGPMANTYYISPTPTEISPFYFMETKIKDLNYDFVSTRKSVNSIVSATNILLANDSIDYIFTDPPFGSNIMYSELNFITESWLRVYTNNKKEAIESKAQNKSILAYQDLMTDCFKEYCRVLKPGRWMTVEFSNTSAAVWNGIQTAIQRAGFVISAVSGINKGRGGMQAIIGVVAVNQDLAITCYKPSKDFENTFKQAPADINIWNFVQEHLQHLPIHIQRDQKSLSIIERSPKIIYDRLITFYLMRGLPVPIDASDFQSGLQQKFIERDSMFFTSEQAAEYDEQKARRGETGQLPLLFDIIYSEPDAVQWLKERLRHKPQTYQDIMPEFRKANVATRKGEREIELKTVLDENFIQETSGRWRVPDMNEAKDREALRTKALLKEFDRYRTELSTAKTKKLKEVRVEALRAGFKSCWEKKDFNTIVTMGDKIPQNLLLEDEQLLMFYDIAKDRI